jgi:hypothetical protein
LAAQTAQAHVLAVVVPPAPGEQSLGVASGADAPQSAYSFGETFSSSPQRFSIAITYFTSKNGTVEPRRRAKERVRFPADFSL